MAVLTLLILKETTESLIKLFVVEKVNKSFKGSKKYAVLYFVHHLLVKRKYHNVLSRNACFESRN